MSSDSQDVNATRLGVGTVRTLCEDGSHDTRHTVLCPRRECSTSIAQCRHCTRFIETRLSRWEADSHLVCRPDASPALPAPSGEGALSCPVSAVMTRNVECVAPEVAVDEVLQLLLFHDLGGVPVLDPNSQPLGVISRSDVLEECCDACERQPSATQAAGARGRATAAEVMTRPAVTVEENARVSDAALLMVLHGVHRLPVVSAEGVLVGIISALDIMRWNSKVRGQEEQPGADPAGPR